VARAGFQFGSNEVTGLKREDIILENWRETNRSYGDSASLIMTDYIPDATLSVYQDQVSEQAVLRLID
jgi:hypothetical protein